ncbi:hypothetical protein A3Q56_04115 [Intoshia linei]|uniref:Netrin-1 n=1 Tax=Intoshia linei TaxID=1819745 RepID=A0A177B2Z8_9BILA|nr:hypothetical protein A3Q56_04115 [Intoshia linei]
MELHILLPFLIVIIKGLNYKNLNPCYDLKGYARYCQPKFINVAKYGEIETTNHCGSESMTSICYNTGNDIDSDLTKCSICTNDTFISTAINDIETVRNKTCWISQPSKDNQKQVQVSIKLEKKYEIAFIIIEFCSKNADSFRILKSHDYEQSWTSYQYYSSNCDFYHNLINENSSSTIKATCKEWMMGNPVYKTRYARNVDSILLKGNTKVAFSTVKGKQNILHFSNNPILQEWMTVTNLKIIFDRAVHPFSIYKNSNYFYGISNIIIGGKCKCNGHASKCILTENDKVTCLCQHNTSGKECQKCSPFHVDRPWMPATVHNANECIACKCNLHSKTCQFDRQFYIQSGFKSGAECLHCQDHTTGRYCHVCEKGYYRDFAKPIIDPQACIDCKCHPVGSENGFCHNLNGICKCKEGVTGEKCNQCAPGFEQSRSNHAPCISNEFYNLYKYNVLICRRN